MSETINLGLPFIEASQAQKHVTHNEALLGLDTLVQAGVKDRDLTAPPGTPSDGDAYIPASGASGDWNGKDLNLAVWQDGVWKFHNPKTGFRVWVEDEAILAIWNGAAWVDFFATVASLQNMSLLGVNTTADATNKLAVSSDAVLFNHNGNGIQTKLNKNSTGDTASHLFQTNWSGRAELGLTGDDDFHLKVSPDGSSWNESILVDKDTGQVSFPRGALVERHLPASVDVAGGAEWWGPADHMTTSYTTGSGQTLVQDRIYFSTFFVPRPLDLIGCFVSLYGASTTPGALLRTGIYELGTPNGNNWDIGNRVADFGTAVADAAGNKIFTLANAQRIEPGWYITAMGVSGAGAKAIYGRWLTPGCTRYYPHNSGTAARPRMNGPSVYLYEGSCNAEITGGLPSSWAKNPVTDANTTNNWVYQFVFPKWREV